jgi:hypothetical protein
MYNSLVIFLNWHIVCSQTIVNAARAVIDT